MTSIKGKNKKDKSNPFAGVNWIPTTKSGSTQPIQRTGLGNNAVPTLNSQPVNNNGGRNPGWEEILQQFGNTSSLADALTSLGVKDPKNFQLSGSDAATWNQQLVTMLLQYLTTQEQRQYNEGLRDEQRIYDSPTNQLARLMGSGISRDAAIQLLGGSGSGSGASAPYGESAGVTASMSDFAAMKSAHDNAFLGTWNASLNTLNTVMSMVNFGLSVPQSIQQTRALELQNYLSQEQVGAYNATKQVTGVAQNLIDSGAVTYDQIKNASDLEKYCVDNKSNPAIKPLFDSGAFQASFGTPYGREFINRHWSQLRDSKNGGTMLYNLLEQQRLQNLLGSVNIEKVGAEIENLSANTRLQDKETLKVFTDIALGESQIRVNDAQVELTSAQTDQVKLNYEFSQTGFPMLKQIKLDEIQQMVDRWTLFKLEEGSRDWNNAVRDMKNSNYYKSVYGWLQEQGNAYHIAYLRNLQLQAAGSFATENPELYKLCKGLKELGVMDMVKDGARVGATAAEMYFHFPTP